MRGVIFFTSSISMLGDPIVWSSTLDKLGFDYYIMIDEDNLVPNWSHSRGIRVSSFNEAIPHIKGTTVMLDANGTVNFDKFIEPKDVCYICGPDMGTLPLFTADQTLTLPAHNLWAIECIIAIWGKHGTINS